MKTFYFYIFICDIYMYIYIFMYALVHVCACGRAHMGMKQRSVWVSPLRNSPPCFLRQNLLQGWSLPSPRDPPDCSLV